MNYHLVTLGCQMNKSDSERVSSVLDGFGLKWVDDESEAQVLGVLACSVRQKAIDKVYSKIHRWNKWKNNKNLITFISGCILPSDKEKFLKLFDIIFPMSELLHLPEMIARSGIVTPLGLNMAHQNDASLVINVTRDNDKHFVENSEWSRKSDNSKNYMKKFWDIKPSYTSKHEAFIPIQNGCDKFCSFCAVPYTRGREVSRPSEEIMQELKDLVESGYKSITLLGQNVNSYGNDKHGHEISFGSLLEKIGKYGKYSGKDFWVYFTSPHPRDMGIDVLEAVSKYSCLAKQIHLPMQSGDDKVLIKMNRKHNMHRYREVIQSIHSILPSATIFTDIIVGFNGETESQFENTRLAMEKFKFNMAYIAMYSPRPGAASSRWKDDVPHEIKKKRLHLLTNELIKHSFEYNKNSIGKNHKVLVTGIDKQPGFLSGLTEGKIIVRFKSDNKNFIGTFVNVRISSATAFATEGELIEINKAAEVV